MNIAIIGKGNVGKALEAGLTRAGHTLNLAGRDPVDIIEAVRTAEIVILAVPYDAVSDIAAILGEAANGKIIVDATNVLTPEFELAVGFGTSGAEILQAKLPNSHVIKAFNTSFATTMETGTASGQQVTGLVAGDHPEAKKVVLSLVAELGFDAVDAGQLSNARLLEPFALLAIRLALVQGHGPFIGFHLVR